MDAFIPHEKFGTLRDDLAVSDQIFEIWQFHNLQRAYSIAEVIEAVQEVCSHYPSPAKATCAVIRSGHDPKILREFFVELVKVSQNYKSRSE